MGRGRPAGQNSCPLHRKLKNDAIEYTPIRIHPSACPSTRPSVSPITCRREKIATLRRVLEGMTVEPRRGVRNGTGPRGRALSWPWHNDALRVPCNTRVLRRRVLRVETGRVPVVRIDAAVPAECVSALGPRVHAVPFGGRAAAAHTVPPQRQHTQGQAVG